MNRELTMAHFTEAEVAMITFAIISFLPVGLTVGATEQWKRNWLKAPCIAVGTLATVPWFAVTSIPAFVLTSVAYRGCAWPWAWWKHRQNKLSQHGF